MERARMELSTIERRLTPLGFIPRGAFRPVPADGVPGTPAILVLVGNAGPAMWRAFTKAVREPVGRDPLDAWTRAALAPVAEGLGAAALFPFDGPPFLPFQRWAQRAEGLARSPVGPLVHPVHGLWHAYRAAFAFARPFPIPEVPPAANPCATCAGKPCLAACPVSALAPGRYDVAACVAHLDAPAGRDCMAMGCAARRACPVGREYAHGPHQAAFHMAHFRRANRPDAT